VSGIAASLRAQARLAGGSAARALPTRVMRGGWWARICIWRWTPGRHKGYVARYLPLRLAAGAAPLLVALAAWPASGSGGGDHAGHAGPFHSGHGAGRGRRPPCQGPASGAGALSGLFVDRLRACPYLSFAEERITRHLGASAQEAARRTMSVLAIAFASGPF
jgi:ATP-binding cassette subfamily C protein CydD